MTLKLKTIFQLIILASAFLVLAASCSKDDNADNGTPPPPPAEKKIRLVEDALGKRFVNAAGQSIYVFAKDFAGTNSCNGACEAAWPIVAQNLTASDIGEGLKFSDFSVITLPNGNKQVTYKGWPLYYFAPLVNGVNTREAAGEIKGQGVGGVWFVAKPDYSVMIAAASLTDKGTGITEEKKFLVDDRGRTLYLFAKDDKNPNSLATNCVDGCISNWPVFFSQNVVGQGDVIKGVDFSSITRNDGPNGSERKHSTFQGKPLYYFVADDARGKAEGHGLLGAGDLWFVVTP